MKKRSSFSFVLCLFLLLSLQTSCTTSEQNQTANADTAVTADTGIQDQPNNTKGVAETSGTPETTRKVVPEDVVLPAGLKIEAVSQGLTYPVDVTFDDEGRVYVAEAGGHTYGTKPEKAPSARIMRLTEDGKWEVVYDKVVPVEVIKNVSFPTTGKLPEGLIPPVTGVTHHEGKLYISHRSRYSTYDLQTGEFKTIVDGLPSWGEFLNAKPIFKDGRMYFFLSTQGNTGVPEKHWTSVMDIFNKPTAREIPGEDVVLTGLNFWVPTKGMKSVNKDSVLTGVYVPLGTVTEYGQVIQGQEVCNGAFYSVNPDGTDLKRIAWGFRSSFGYRFSPDGRLITTMNSANPMPPRGLYFDYEQVYEVKEGEWYGWPDFYSGIPITDERFEYKDEVRKFALTEETHRRLLKGKERPLQPLALLPVHSAAEGMVFGREGFGVAESDILVAEFGAIIPFFKGEKYHPNFPKEVPESAETAPPGVSYNWPGFKVQRVDLSTGKAYDYIYNESRVPASATQNAGGLERPIQMEWSPNGDLYIVDFGIVEFNSNGMSAHPFTGVLWKVSKR
ncbi:glucose/arabinose dehydrogenase [Pontibacter ummariensis]|uniref:Glucose/arabinose dehydrogenase, beta-propeller fold n=1 Tax=Pontibacter ummariensis TaxID=1610492 RepID=A0A239DQ06_9BACT|nr:hypothetical protein [Pontibacter ummariensis]PRY13802.1 glucose/arabinose dehydrogenase [Pontibacter ummariensis]SNS34735.1 Glucose/arabinose dehydrogenase, beta-propeller fold [Pontibacter ummariensis]